MILSATMASPLLQWTDLGLFCEKGDFYIDPNCSARRPVRNAVITHAHSDHARRGADLYYCVDRGVELLRTRLGRSIHAQSFPYQKTFSIGGVFVSFHSAGHILGSAQVRVESEGEVWIASGDYKREQDPSCDPFETVTGDVFITEATFGTPKYSWNKTARHGEAIHQWWLLNAAQGKNSLLFGYSLGKSQRVLAELAPLAHRPIWIHPSLSPLTQCYRDQGIKMALTRELRESDRPMGDLIIAPPSVLKDNWTETLGTYHSAFASGWAADSQEGFLLSDHADWNDLHQTIRESRAHRVFVMHRNEGALVRSLRKEGLDAHGIENLRAENYARLPQANLSLF
jgi:putative mRNA 3-end processing factor